MESLPIIEMASAKKNPDKTGKPEKTSKSEKSPEQARGVYEKRFRALTLSIQSQIAEYKAKLQDESFEDQDGEIEGSGEKRKEEMQKSITNAMEKVESMKAVLDSGEEIPSITNEIQVDYAYTNPNTNKVERQESITLDIEKAIEKYISLYQETNIQLPNDFNEQVLDIWSRNSDEIEKVIEENGFDDMIVAPANIPLDEIKDKMKMEKGYYTSGNFDSGGGFSGAVSSGVDKIRIILVHKVQEIGDSPELKASLGIKAQDTDIDKSLSLEDYLYFQRSYFKETGKHLDEKTWSWLTKTKSGSRFVDSRWYPSCGWLSVSAGDAGSSDAVLGSRVSRYFF